MTADRDISRSETDRQPGTITSTVAEHPDELAILVKQQPPSRGRIDGIEL